jgi:hypothetical protein
VPGIQGSPPSDLVLTQRAPARGAETQLAVNDDHALGEVLCLHFLLGASNRRDTERASLLTFRPRQKPVLFH